MNKRTHRLPEAANRRRYTRGGGSMNERGVALIVALSVALIVGLLVLAAAVTGVIDRTVSANQYRSNAAYYAAQTGVEYYKTALFRNLVDFYASSGVGWCESPIGDGIRDENGNVILVPGGTSGWQSLPGVDGRFRGTLVVDGTYLVITSVGELGDATATVQLVASAGGGPASSWENAILAQGTTPGSRAINGNVAVYGSVHIVDGDLDGTIGLSGTAGIFNTYTGGGNQTNIVNDITDIVDTNVDLCTRLKIANGNVWLGGNSQLGNSGTGEAIYSVHFGSGIICTESEPNQQNRTCRDRNEVVEQGDSNEVFVRYPEEGPLNSPYAPYDVELPVLRQEAFDRAFTVSVDGTPRTDCEWLYASDGVTVVLPPPSGAFSGATSPTCGDGTNSVQWRPSADGGYLQISGDVNLPEGQLLINGAVNYQGKGTLLVGAELDDSGARVTVTNSGSLRPTGFRTYPLTNAIGVLSTGDIEFGSTASQAASAAMLYARGAFRAQRQVTILGAVIADSFDLGTNVPRIAYHPDVRYAAEVLCLPGTACAEDGTPQNPGILADIAIERR